MRRVLTMAIATIAATAMLPVNAAPANDDFVDATEVGAVPYQDQFIPLQASRESEEPAPCGSYSRTVWYTWEAASAQAINADTLGSDFPAAVAVFSGSGPFDLTLVECHALTEGGSVRFTSIPNQRYYIQVATHPYDGVGIFNLGPPAAAAGEVVDAVTLDPISDVCVDIFDATLQRAVGSAVTDLDGEYLVDDLPATDVKIRFKDCADHGPGTEFKQRAYSKQWFSGAKTFATADVVSLVGGSTVTNIDVALTSRPRPDVAVTGMRVTSTPLTLGPLGDSGVTTGTTHDVEVDVANVGPISPRWTTVTVDVCPRTMGSCETLGTQNVSLPPGAGATLIFRWESIDVIGDVSITAMADLNEDLDWSNNVAEIFGHVHIGGTGVGVRVEPS